MLTPKNIQKYIQDNWVGWVITLGAIIVVSLFHWIGAWIEKGTDIVLVEVDDEAWRLMPEEWPYPRGSVWGRVVRNLYKAGAKVIVFDIQFDAPENRSEIYQDLIESTSPEYIIDQVPNIRDTTQAKNIWNAIIGIGSQIKKQFLIKV